MTTTTFGLRFDDASLFPPCGMVLEAAVQAHRAHRAASYAGVVGPFVVGVAHLVPLLSVRGHAEFDLAVVAPDPSSARAALGLARSHGLRIVAVEISDAAPFDDLSAVADEVEGVTTWIELPRGEAALSVAAALAGGPFGGKIRTGGVEASMHPGEAELADTVCALVKAGVPFKATAGLHHALRRTDPETGFEPHGFLNLLAATAAAERGADASEVSSVLAERDATSLGGLGAFDVPTLLRSVGTCSITDPVADLRALGWAPEQEEKA